MAEANGNGTARTDEDPTVHATPEATTAARKTKPKPEKPLKLYHVREKRISVVVRGTSVLITNKFGHEPIKKIADKQQGKAAEPRGPKEPHALYMQSIYFMPGSGPNAKVLRCGISASAFKKACVSAAKFTGKALTTGFIKGAFHIDEEAGGLVELRYDNLRMREDPVRLQSTGTADLRYRAEFSGWEATLPIRYNESVISPEQIINLLNVAGFSVGVGEWRPEKGGSKGCFTVHTGAPRKSAAAASGKGRKHVPVEA